MFPEDKTLLNSGVNPTTLGGLSGGETSYALGVSHLPETERTALVLTTRSGPSFLLNRERVTLSH